MTNKTVKTLGYLFLPVSVAYLIFNFKKVIKRWRNANHPMFE